MIGDGGGRDLARLRRSRGRPPGVDRCREVLALLPDFVIIGAQKAGSTALMRHLGAHPQVFVPDHEVRHFRDPWFAFGDRSVLEREVAGARPDQRRGIKCPDLLGLPEAPARVHDELGDVQLLAVLREPVSRAISAWSWMVQFGFLPHEDPETGLTRVLDGRTDDRYPRAREVLDFGMYHQGLTRWIERFGRDRLLVLLDGDLRQPSSPAYGEVCEFLGVAPFAPAAAGSHNEGVYDLRRLRWLERRNRFLVREFPGYEGRYIQGPDGTAARLYTGALTAVDRTVLRRVLGNERPPVSEQLTARLTAYYRDDVERLGQLLGRDLTDPRTGWSAPARSRAQREDDHPMGGATSRRAQVRATYFPETAVDGYSRVDSAVEFYLRVNALVDEHSTVLDFGAGRAQWTEDTASRTRNRLRLLKGKVAKVVGSDPDPVVTSNPTLDEAVVTPIGEPLPFDDATFDLVVSDYTFEHIDDPAQVTSELDRVLKPGGWICARTPNRHGYIGLSARAVPNDRHASWLTRLQPGRKEIDVFPVRYNLNTPADVRRWFPADRFEVVAYTMPGEPNYAGSSLAAWRAVGGLLKLTPARLGPVLLVFIRKR